MSTEKDWKSEVIFFSSITQKQVICYELRRCYMAWVFYRVILVSVKWWFSDLSIALCDVPGLFPKNSGTDFSVGLSLSFVLFW